MDNLIHGLAALGSFHAVAYLVIGSVIGVIVGVIPGLSTVIILSVILVFTQYLNLTDTLSLFLGAQCGGFYAASVTAILINTPAHPEAFPITLDGYPMARKGEPGRALGLSACSTCVGGLIGCVVLVVFLQVLDRLPNMFHPPDYVALVVLAMLLVGTLATNSVGKAIVSAGMGLLIASVGPSLITGVYRYTFGSVSLGDGVSLVAVALGIFAVPQMLMVYGTGKATARQDITGREIDDSEQVEVHGGYARELLGGVVETFKHWAVLLQSGLIGGLTGIVPGIGGFTGNFMAYGIARQLSSKQKRDKFGTGIPDGIIAPEGSSLAKEAGHIVPLLGLGIPGGTAGALFIGALAMKGMKVGYGFQNAYPHAAGQIVGIIFLSGLLGTVVGVLIGPQLARVTKVPGPLIVPIIFVLCICGPFFTDATFFSIGEMFVFGLVGLTFRRLRYPLGPFMLGLVLGPTFETNIYLTHTVYPGLSWVTKRPLADAILVLCVILLVSKALEVRRASRANRTRIGATAKADGAVPASQLTASPYPVLALVVTTLLLVVGLYFVVYALTNYDFATGAMPTVGGIGVAVPALIFLPRDIRDVVVYCKRRRVNAVESLDRVDTPAAVSLVPSGAGDGGTASVAAVARTASAPVPSAGHGPAPIREKSFGVNGQYRREAIAVALLALLIAMCWLLGFAVAVPIFVLLYGLTCTKRHFNRLHGRIIYSVAAAVVMWLVVHEMFQLSHLTFTPILNLGLT